MPARGGCDKKEGFVPPRHSRHDYWKHEGVGAGVPIERGAARRYVHAYRGLVNKPPGQTHGQPHVVRGLVKLDLSAPDVTGPRVFWVWIERQSRRKLWGT